MTKAVVCGAAGRMGRLIIKVITETPGLSLAGAVEAAGHPMLGQDAGQVAGVGALGVPITWGAVPEGDVLIDFSLPAAVVDHCREAARTGMAIVVGTTGLSADECAAIEALSDRSPVLVSSNMSVGVHLLMDLVRRAAERLGEGFDIEIVEAHHRHKKDAPSGTALSLLKAACEGRGWDPDEVAVFGREGKPGERPDRQIGVFAVRGGEIVGDHTVMFIGAAERIELSHFARDREVFARGAVRVAAFLAGKPPGVYTMKDALGL